jgi:hypothetical protein
MFVWQNNCHRQVNMLQDNIIRHWAQIHPQKQTIMKIPSVVCTDMVFKGTFVLFQLSGFFEPKLFISADSFTSKSSLH